MRRNVYESEDVRNVHEYEDVRNVHKYEDEEEDESSSRLKLRFNDDENDNIAVPDNTDEMFETLYAHETLYHDITTPRDATPVRSTSLWADDSQARQNEASAGVDEISTMNPAGPVAPLPRNSVDPRRESLVQIGRNTAA